MTEVVYEEGFNWKDEISRLQNNWMVLKDEYSEVARALGFEGDALFGDPFASHEEIVKQAKYLYDYHMGVA